MDLELMESSVAVNCPDCGEPAGRADRYCEECGGGLLLRRTPEGGPVGRVSERTCVACGTDEIGADGFCGRCGRAQPTGRDRMEYDLGLVAGVSDRGRARARNEDSMSFAVVGPQQEPTAVAVVVCDGVGSTARADQASQAAVDAALAVVVDSLLDGKDAAEATTLAAAAAYDSVGELAVPDSNTTAPSCTFVSAVVTADEITVGWIGDSRAYWVSGSPEEPSRRLTTDDTLVAQLIEAGVSEQEASAALNAHALARWVGADADAGPPHVVRLRPQGRGRLVVCSDGLWNYLADAGALAAKTGSGSPFTAAAELTAVALELGGHDNITVVVVPFPITGTDPNAGTGTDGEADAGTGRSG